MGTHFRRDVTCVLSHHRVGDGGDACGDDHAQRIDGARVVDLEGGGSKVLHDTTEEKKEVELLGVPEGGKAHKVSGKAHEAGRRTRSR